MMMLVRRALSLANEVFRQPSTYAALGLAIALTVIRFSSPVIIEGIQMRVFDSYQRAWPREIAASPVVIADIDEKSLGVLGQWPWPRSTMAQLINTLRDAGALVVALDIVYAEPDRLSAGALAATFPGLDAETLKTLEKLPDTDKILSRAFLKMKVVAGQPVSNEPRHLIDTSKIRQPQPAMLGPRPHAHLPTYTGLIRNIPRLDKTARGHGVISLDKERDGIVRRIPTLFSVGGKIFPSLGIEALRLAANGRNFSVRTQPFTNGGVSKVQAAGVWIPTDRRGRMWVRFRPHAKEIYHSISDILAGDFKAGTFQGKIVFVGTSAVGLEDLKQTPLEEKLPGVEVHAQALENIISGQFLSRPLQIDALELGSILAAALAFVFMLPMLGSLGTLMVLGLVSSGFIGASIYLFKTQGILIDAVYPVFAAAVLFSLLTFINYLDEERKRQQIRSAFSFYLSPTMVDQLSKNPEGLKLGGESREMTILFSDIQGFTSISEKFDATTLTGIINKILTPLSNEIMDGGGTIDKFMGDCVMAFWNAPLEDLSHAKSACRAALRMPIAMDGINQRLHEELYEQGLVHQDVAIGIGINTGTVCVGNVGSDQRFEYSVLGDDVNLASRLEGQTRNYGVPIIIGEDTAQQSSDFAIVELDMIVVKGKTLPVRIYALLGEEEMGRQESFKTLETTHVEMLEAYRAQRWDRAEQAAAKGLALAGEFGIQAVYELYLDRVSTYRKDPPGDDWDGAYRALTK